MLVNLRGRRLLPMVSPMSRAGSGPTSPARAMALSSVQHQPRPPLTALRVLWIGFQSVCGFYVGLVGGSIWSLSRAVPKLIELPESQLGGLLCGSLREFEPCARNEECRELLEKDATSRMLLSYVLACRSRASDARDDGQASRFNHQGFGSFDEPSQSSQSQSWRDRDRSLLSERGDGLVDEKHWQPNDEDDDD